MTILSSHVLDATTGRSANGVRVQLYRLISDTRRERVFDVTSDHEGRLVEQFEVDGQQVFELVFYSAAYFQGQSGHKDETPYMSTVVIRLTMQDRPERYHIPLVLSSHAYTVWWSQ